MPFYVPRSLPLPPPCPCPRCEALRAALDQTREARAQLREAEEQAARAAAEAQAAGAMVDRVHRLGRRSTEPR